MEREVWILIKSLLIFSSKQTKKRLFYFNFIPSKIYSNHG
jgi:hypothetical protein